ncbi:MAG: MFS transporter [Phycisphaerales bacterium]
MSDHAPHDPFAALRERNYRRFAGGWSAFTMGTRMQGVAVAWEVYERTGDEQALGLIGLAQAVPVIALALFGGHVADLHDRKRIVFFSQIVFFLGSLGLAAVSYFAMPVWYVYALLVLTGSAKAFNSPARGALLPQLVPPGTFPNAVAWNSSLFQVAAIGGPLLSGAMIPLAHAAWPVCLVAAVGSLVFASMISGVEPRPIEKRPGNDGRRTVSAGLRFLLREKTVLAAITLDLFAVLLGGATALLPVYAKDVLHVSPERLGMLAAAPYVGALISAQILTHRPPFRRAGRALLWSVAGFGVATIGFGLSTNFYFSLALLGLLGGLDGVSVVIRHVLVQVRTPEELRGRVAAVNSVFIESSNELGAFESGLVAKLFSPVVSVVSGGIGTLVVVAALALLNRPLRELGELREPERKV